MIKLAKAAILESPHNGSGGSPFLLDETFTSERRFSVLLLPHILCQSPSRSLSRLYPSVFVFSLQLGVRRGPEAEGGGEEALQAFSVPHPRPPLVPRAQAAQTHETRERQCCFLEYQPRQEPERRY